MIYEVVMSRFSAAAVLILWLSLVALCDPYPPYGGDHSTKSRTIDEIGGNSSSPFSPHKGLVARNKLLQNSTNSAQLSEQKSALLNSSNSPLLEPLSPSMAITNSHEKRSPPLATTSEDSLMKNFDTSGATADPSVTNLQLSRKRDKSSKDGEKGSVFLSPDITPEELSRQPHFSLKLDRDYSPDEIADYIFSTGDEKGFSQVVAEMVQDGEITGSKDDVILFLEEVQLKLAKLRSGIPSRSYKEQLPNRDD